MSESASSNLLKMREDGFSRQERLVKFSMSDNSKKNVFRSPSLTFFNCAYAATGCLICRTDACPIKPRHEKICFCICVNKGADQLRGNRTADQRNCFRYINSTVPRLLKSEIFKPLVICSSCTARFVSSLVDNPEDRFYHAAANLKPRNSYSILKKILMFCIRIATAIRD